MVWTLFGNLFRSWHVKVFSPEALIEREMLRFVNE
jgi:hypothetical protein